MHEYNLSVLLLACLLQEAGRHAVADGHADQPGRPVPFIEFADLEPAHQQLRLTNAANLLARVEPWCPATNSTPLADAVDWLARVIHETDTGHDAEFGPYLAFDDAYDGLRAIRRGQATYLLARFGFKDTETTAAA